MPCMTDVKMCSVYSKELRLWMVVQAAGSLTAPPLGSLDVEPRLSLRRLLTSLSRLGPHTLWVQ